MVESATQRARRLLEVDFVTQLEGELDILRDGMNLSGGGPHLSSAHWQQRVRIVAAVEHKQASGLTAADALADYLRDAAFTTLNRFVALKMLEVRGLVQQCVSKGEFSSGYAEFTMLAKGLENLPNGYRIYLESIFDELATEVKVLFDRRDPASALWPRRPALLQLLGILNDSDLSSVWAEDETIGWVYQYFNSAEERQAARKESQAPRNSRELAIRNQFFTPRYVVQFLTDNTLGRIWHEMRGGDTALRDRCEYLVLQPEEHVTPRQKKDPRDIRILDPACGSGHFLLYAFDLLVTMYEEAYADPESPPSETTGRTLAQDYPDRDGVRSAMPGLILAMNLHGVDIDPRCSQIAALALWMRAQRAYNNFGSSRDGRRPIHKTNVVVAGPMPGEPELLREFVATLEPRLARLVNRVFSRLALAGEAGVLLPIEEDIREAIRDIYGEYGGLFAESDVDRWEAAESELLSALRNYATTAQSSSAYRRQLFASDAAQGFGFIDICRKRYDVTLMNPPFGLATDETQSMVSRRYAGAHNDIYAAFVRRGRELAPNGRTGAITSRSFLVARRLERFRRDDVIPNIELLLDLGIGVMDSASVEAAAYVMASPARDFLAVDRRNRLDVLEAESRIQDWSKVERGLFESMPRAKILYNMPRDMARLLRQVVRFEPSVGTAREGMKTFDNDRFLRTWWEVPADQIGWDARWRWFAKGGQNVSLWGPLPLVLNWSGDGAELQTVNLNVNGSTAQVRQASQYWGRAGITYSRRAPLFQPRLLPAGYVFSDKGPAIIVESDSTNAWFVLGWLCSRLVQRLLLVQVNKQDYLTGIVKALPWSSPAPEAAEQLSVAVKNAVRLALMKERYEETSVLFDPIRVLSELDHLDRVIAERVESAGEARLAALTLADATVDAVYGVDSSVWELTGEIEPDEEDAAPARSDPDDLSDGSDAKKPLEDLQQLTTSAAFAIVFGHRPSDVDEDEDILQRAIGEPVVRAPLGLRTILCDDPGHESDVVDALASACSVGISDDFVAGLRPYLAASGAEGFFSRHIATYSTRSRRAPIYWQLATSSARFSAWLYYHGLTKDTLYRLGADYVAPKLRHEERRLAEMQNPGAQLNASRRRELAEQETFVEELRSFLEEVLRVAPLWNPNLNDGVIINFAPLWRLVPHHKAWQKELKATWEALCAGEYDWAFLAMHLWPERVVAKCAADRSLAVAHGLEGVFWEQDSMCKWRPRTKPARPVDELIRELTSSAVKAALEDLLNAPAAAGQGPGRRRTAGSTRRGR